MLTIIATVLSYSYLGYLINKMYTLSNDKYTQQSMTNKMDDETGPSFLNMSDYFFVPNFEVRPMFSAKNLERYDIF